MKKCVAALVALLLAGLSAATAFADATPYASVRFASFYKTTDQNDTGTDDNDEDLLFNLFSNSRFGVKFKADALTGVFEVSNAVSLRHLYGVYDFGAGALLIGQTYRPYFIAGDTAVGQLGIDNGALDGWGSFGHRIPQMRLALKMGLYAALLTNGGTDNADVIDLPELAVGYIGSFGKTTVGVHASYMEDDQDATDIGSYLLTADVKTQAGPVGVLAKVFYGENLKNYSSSMKEGLTAGTASADYTDFGGFAQASFKISDMLSVIGGVGYVNNETTGADDDRMVYFINLPIKVAKGFKVMPEIAYYDGMDDNSAGNKIDGADSLWFGATWQMDF